MTQKQKKISEDIGDFFDKKIQKTSGFIMDKGFEFAENIGLSVLKRTAKNDRLMKVIHSKAPQMSQLFNSIRRSSPAISFMMGKIARKSMITGIRMGFKILDLSVMVLKRKRK